MRARPLAAVCALLLAGCLPCNDDGEDRPADGGPLGDGALPGDGGPGRPPIAPRVDCVMDRAVLAGALPFTVAEDMQIAADGTVYAFGSELVEEERVGAIVSIPVGGTPSRAVPFVVDIEDDERLSIVDLTSTRDRWDWAVSAPDPACDGTVLGFHVRGRNEFALWDVSAGASLTRRGEVAAGGVSLRPNQRLAVDSCGRAVGTAQTGDETLAVVRFEADGGAQLVALEGAPIEGTAATWEVDPINNFGAIASVFADDTILRSGPHLIRVATDGATTCLLGPDPACLVAGEASDGWSATERAVAFGALVDDAVGVVTVRDADEGFDVETLTQADLPEGYRTPTAPIVCAATDEVHFLSDTDGLHTDLLVQRADGTVDALSSYEARTEADPEYAGPRKPRAYALGPNCDALLIGSFAGEGSGAWWIGRDGATATLIHGNQEIEGQTLRLQFPVPGRAIALRKMGGNGVDHRPKVVDAAGRVVVSVEDVDDRRLYLLRGDPPRDRCLPPVFVNTPADGDDAAPGDGRCDTGAPVGAEPECTLRAAIQEANASDDVPFIGFDVPTDSVVELLDPLPPITSSVTIDAGTLRVVVDGAAAGVAEGLTIEDGVIELRGVTIRGVQGDAIDIAPGAELHLRDSHVEAAAGHGVVAEGLLVAQGAEGAPVRIEDCGASGIFSPGDDTVRHRLEHVALRRNGDAGILSGHRLYLANVEASDNGAQGVATLLEDSRICDVRVEVPYGRLVARGNGGHGLHIECGSLLADLGDLDLRDNAGFGLFVDQGEIFIGDPVATAVPSTITGNGVGESYELRELDGSSTSVVAPAGGVYGYFPDRSRGAPQRLHEATISNNDGPGVLLTHPVWARNLTLEDNAADGLVVALPLDVVATAEQTVLQVDFGTIVSRGNGGHGIRIDSGALSAGVEARFTVSENGGWGILSEGGRVRLGAEAGSRTVDPNLLRENGRDRASCRFADVDAEGNPAETTGECVGGGIGIVDVVPDPRLRSLVDFVELTSNDGPGILSTDALTANRVTATLNRGDGVYIAFDEDGFDLAFAQTLGPSIYDSNVGHGVHVDDGDVDLVDDVTLVSNAGAGVRVGRGDLRFRTGALTVRDNGAGPTCVEWPADGITGAIQPCTSEGGLWLEDGSLDAENAVVTANQGVGIRATDVTLTGGQLCANTTADIQASGAESLTAVNRTCP